MEPKKISGKLLTRLPIYSNYLKSLPKETVNISATKIAAALGLGDVLVRKDLAQISNGGRRKIGYVRTQLIEDIDNYLNSNNSKNVILIGSPLYASALLNYEGFSNAGIKIKAFFSTDAVENIVDHIPTYPIESLESYCSNHGTSIGILSSSKNQAQNLCDAMIACGIRAIYNFVPLHLQTPDNILVNNADLTVGLTSLCMALNEKGVNH